MTERKKDLFALSLLLFLLILFFSKILFTDKIIRAPDIINEFYWSALAMSKLSLKDVFFFPMHATWSIYGNSGTTLLGGDVSTNFNFWQKLIFIAIPLPASIAWHIVLHFFIGAAGVFFYCRAIGISRYASFIAGSIFALSPEMASLINAGHVLKIATISVAPWAFFLLEKGFQRQRTVWFMAVGLSLAFQFFYTHWQVAFYTCLCVGLYGIVRLIILLREKNGEHRVPLIRLISMNLVTLFFFLSTVSISLAPLASWSTDTNRGVQSGANQGKGGLDREEAMSWSMPPEELGTFVIPGFFGFSRQEGGPNPTNINSYYWGRMVFTQTTSYIGLLPWLLLPLPLLFRRDRYTLLAMLAIVGGILFSMGKYTPFYNFLFDHFPGINRFRVPKMIMFIPVIGLGVMAGRGVDLLCSEGIRSSKLFRRYLIGVALLPLLLLLLLASLKFGMKPWLNLLYEMIIQPTRYEQGEYLVQQRWNNILMETGIATGIAALYGVAILGAGGGFLKGRVIPLFLMTLFLIDVGRVNAKFLFLTEAPLNIKGAVTPTVEFLKKGSNHYRVLPLSQDSAYLSSNNIPTLFTPMPVQQVRWQEFLDILNLQSALPDMLNIRYLVTSPEEYAIQQSQFGERYNPVFRSPDGKEIVLENRNVLPKAWLVPAILKVENHQQLLQAMQNREFNPRSMALVETAPPIPMPVYGEQNLPNRGEVTIKKYEGEKIELIAKTSENSLLVLGEKYYQGWKGVVDDKPTNIVPVNNILRGVYLTKGEHTVEFIFDPLPFKIGKLLTLSSFVLFGFMLFREWSVMRKNDTRRA